MTSVWKLPHMYQMDPKPLRLSTAVTGLGRERYNAFFSLIGALRADFDSSWGLIIFGRRPIMFSGRPIMFGG